MRRFKIIPYRNEELRNADLLDPNDVEEVLNARTGVQFLSDHFGGHLQLWSNGTREAVFMITQGHNVPDMVTQIHNFINFIEIGNNNA